MKRAPRINARLTAKALWIVSCAWVLPISAQSTGGKASRIAPDVRAALQADGKAVVFVNLSLPNRSRSAVERRNAIHAACRDIESRVAASKSVHVRCRFDWIPSLVLEIRDAATLDALDELGEVASVHLDVRGHGALLESSPYIHAPEVHALGFEGEGSIAAVLDTGVDTDHPSLVDAVIHTYHFLDQGQDTGPNGAEDGHGHGTNVTGIIASRGIGAPAGIAPKAKIVTVKVLDDSNSGWLSDWALGVNHVISLKNDDGIPIDVINMSLVSNSTYPGECDDHIPAFAAACSAARDSGIAVFVASGNDGEHGFMTIPACYSSVISVGSVKDTAPDRISSFTNRDEFLDILAPGERITSTGIGGGTSTFMGTSQATPHAAAVACILREIDASISPAEVKDVLLRSGRPFADAVTGLTFPILDAQAAAEGLIVPRMRNLGCGASAGQLVASWDAAEVDHFHVEVSRDAVEVFSGDLPGGETRFEQDVSLPGEYAVCVRAFDFAGMKGLEECCSVHLEPKVAFVRGDCSQDGRIDIADPVRLVTSLFSGGVTLPCEEACDGNNDDRLDVSDAIYPLNYLFRGGPAPTAPFPACGLDPSGNTLGCAEPRC